MENHKKIDSKKISEIYRECSQTAKFFYDMGQDPDITYLEFQYNDIRNRYRNTRYSEEGYVKKMLCARELWKTFSLSRFGVKWEAFKSPIEVLGFNALSFLWSPKFIAVNEKDPTGKYEIDLSARDVYGNSILLVDLQGKWHEEQIEQDEEKKKYFEEQGIMFVQVTGSEMVNQHYEWIVRFSELLKESLAVVNLSFLCSHPNHTKNKTCFKRKP
ncbi:hypothetical protein [Peribacillus loiseleuriae]|uniref:hypothetical protein n=1 Tax=Peribacillus loiseleuriae TaxID=1679170 RepID=UPI003D0871B0